MSTLAHPSRPVVTAYESSHHEEAVGLILHVQNVESKVGISLEDQPDLLDIEGSYLTTGGGFWVALDDAGHVVGTIGLLVKTASVAVLKKFFVNAAYRGAGTGCASQLFDALLSHAKARGIETIVLDTPSVATRSHAFYERVGFIRISEAELPVQYDYPNRNSLLYRLDLDRAA
jgi:GNAT superfamily N-acetyltransferase